ncbi:MAG: type VI secretion system lipoprotein TssJ [Polyangiaceae bacterium]|nr:type VI secretion system lipoprotein TssJ [Polyangiaceae bacterium]
MVAPRTLHSLPPRLAALALAITAFGSLGATCGPQAPVEPPKPCDVQIVTLNIYASDNINPNENGNPRPVVVQLYQLKNEVRMENATYDQIYKDAKGTLEDDVLKVDELSVFPNDLVEVKFERIKEASTLAGVALFHGPKGSSWKTFYEFPLMPGEVSCGGRGKDGGAPEADPRTAFFIDGSKIDNGSQFDESMFPNANPVRKVNLPKKAASPEGGPAAK